MLSRVNVFFFFFEKEVFLLIIRARRALPIPQVLQKAKNKLENKLKVENEKMGKLKWEIKVKPHKIKTKIIINF